MRKNRVIEQNRYYHLVSRLAHRAFFLDDEEKDRAVALMRRVEEFSGVVVLAYAFMSNHFHIFIYVPSAEEIGEGDTRAPCRRAHAAVCAKGDGRHQEPNPLFQVLPEAADGEGHDRKNRSGQSEIAQTGVQAGMSYYINNTMSIGSFAFPKKDVCVSANSTRYVNVPIYDSPCLLTERSVVLPPRKGTK